MCWRVDNRYDWISLIESTRELPNRRTYDGCLVVFWRIFSILHFPHFISALFPFPSLFYGVPQSEANRSPTNIERSFLACVRVWIFGDFPLILWHLNVPENENTSNSKTSSVSTRELHIYVMQDTFIVTCVNEAGVLGSNIFYVDTNLTPVYSDNALLSLGVTMKWGVKQTRIENFHLIYGPSIINTRTYSLRSL